MPNVWRYRQAFESRLPKVFEHLADLHRSLVAYSGRLGAESFRAQCGFVVEIWENWIVFTPQVTEQMKAILNGASADGRTAPTTELVPTTEATKDTPTPSSSGLPSDKFKKAGSGFKASFKPIAAEAAPVAAATDEDLDGEAMEDLDGQAMDELDGEAMEDLDGEAIKLEGEDMELDGEDMELDV
jgi:U2-associated protein SR140